MAQQHINVGTVANDGTGDPNRTAFQKCEANFNDLYTASSGYQPLDADLTSLAAANLTNTLYYRSAAGVWSPVTLGSGLTFSGGVLTATGGAAAVTGTLGVTEAGADTANYAGTVVTPGVDPIAIFGANLKGWWAADNTVPLADKSGGGRPLQAFKDAAGGTGAGSPTIDPTGINGFPAYKFLTANPNASLAVGNSGGGGVPSDQFFPALGASGAVFTVMKYTSSTVSGSNRIFSMHSSTSGAGTDADSLNGMCGYIGGSNLLIRIQANSLFTITTGINPGVTAGELFITCHAWNSTTLFLYKNNSTAVASLSAGGTLNIGGGSDFSKSSFLLGNSTALDAPLDGWIGECFVVNTDVITAGAAETKRLAAYSYLHSKFGVGP